METREPVNGFRTDECLGESTVGEIPISFHPPLSSTWVHVEPLTPERYQTITCHSAANLRSFGKSEKDMSSFVKLFNSFSNLPLTIFSTMLAGFPSFNA